MSGFWEILKRVDIRNAEEYENMSNEDKKKYHSRMERRVGKKGDIELQKFHGRQYLRLRRNSSLPVFYSPEHEQEEQ